MKQVLAVFFFLSVVFPAIAGKSLKYDTVYVKDYPKHITLRTFSGVRANHLYFNDDDGTRIIDYRANQNVRFGLGFSYRWLNLTTSFASPFSGIDNEAKGETTHFDLQWNFYYQLFGLDFRLQYFKGYYLQNSHQAFQNWNSREAQFFIRPDIEVFSLGANIYYVFNEKQFSYKAVFTQTTRQKKSKGSWLLGARFDIVAAQADSAFLIGDNWVVSQEYADVNAMGNFTVGVGPGYGQTWVWNDYYFFTLSGLFFVNLQSIAYNTIQDKQEITGNISGFTQIRTAIGYNNDRNIVGLGWVFDGVPLGRVNNERVFYRFTNFKLYYARRFHFKSTLKKAKQILKLNTNE